MEVLPVDGKALVLPMLIPSISSFETQLSPVDALRLQITMQEPVSLVSAFDLVADEGGELAEMCRAFRERGVMFLDSGGYETSRWARYGGKFEWSIESFLAAAEADLFDFAFSFDEFPNLDDSTSSEVDTWESYADRLESLLKKQSVIPDHKLIPVVHLRARKTRHRFSDEEIINLLTNIAERRSSTFIAVTERELGDGLSARVALAGRIKKAIDDASGCKLHVLGCGNPLSFAAFAAVGVDCCDGLEWCRTYCSSDMRLYHYQQTNNVGKIIEPVAWHAQFVIDNSHDYYVRTAAINLSNSSNILKTIQKDPSIAVRVLETSFSEQIAI